MRNRTWPELGYGVVLKGGLFVLLGVVAIPGCAATHLPTVMDAVREGRIPELACPAVTGSYILPEQATGRRYSQVELLQNVCIGAPEQGTKTCSFVMGRRTSDGQWEIASAAVRNEDGTWRELAVTEPTAQPAHCESAGM